MSIRYALSLAAVAITAIAAPAHNTELCKVPEAALQLPPNQTALVAPSSAPRFAALGVGVQNYTCASSGTYT